MNRLTPALCLAALAAAGPALAQPAAASARSLVATCANCHGTDGRAIPLSGMATIAGLPKETIVQRMREFRSGARPATVMHQIAKGYSDEQVAVIADYLATQKAGAAQ